jgi:phosphate transport system protein
MIEDPRKITAGLLATAIAKNLERIGDHALNIAEMVIYIVAGKDVRHMNYNKAADLLGGKSREE